MSKQLSVSAAFSIFAMAAFALFTPSAAHTNETGATVTAAAPALSVALAGF